MLNQQKRRWEWNRKQTATAVAVAAPAAGAATIAVVSKSSARMCLCIFLWMSNAFYRWFNAVNLNANTHWNRYLYAKDMAHTHFAVLHTAFHFYSCSSLSLSLIHLLMRSLCVLLLLLVCLCDKIHFLRTTNECSFFFGICECVCGCSLVSYCPNEEAKKWFQHKRSAWIYSQP